MLKDIEKDKYIEEVARATIKILKKEGAIRRADSVNPDGVYLEALLVELEDIGFPISAPIYYNDVRPKCIAMGYDVTANGKGQYIGAKGEAVARNVKNARDQILGRTHNQRKILTAASEAMTLEEGNKYSKVNFGMDLGTAAKLFKVVGDLSGDYTLPWPKELHAYLLEAGNSTQDSPASVG